VRDETRPTVGIDFGTSTTLIAYGEEIVWLGSAYPWIPSLVGYDDDGSVVAGEAAQFARPGQVIRSIKRAITERRTAVRVDAPGGTRDVRADDLMAEILRKVVRRAIFQDVDLDRCQVQLGCPAMWDGRQRRRLIEVARRVGLPVTLASLVDEPVAAGVAWLAGRPALPAGPVRVFVFDMGGGTLDLAVLDVRGPDHREVSVLAAVGVAEAGDRLDEAVADDLDDALVIAGVDIDALPHPHLTDELLLDGARKLKVGLTTELRDVVVLPPDVFGPNELWYGREQLDAAFAPQLDRAVEYVTATLRAARLAEVGDGAGGGGAEIDYVVLSGGMSQIPYVAQRLRKLFPPTTRVEVATTPPEIAVALGLAGSARYGRVNRYRPPFDLLVDWDGGSCQMYEAFLPLVESWQIVRGDTDLRYVRTGRQLSLPEHGTGRLRVVSHATRPVPATLNGVPLDGFPIVFGADLELSLYPDGRIRLIDHAGVHYGQMLDG
jgi:molecular chaperone DnaK (HSP70)